MTQLLNVSRAARLAGVTRREIQQKIQSGELMTFEGDVQITDLLRVFPEINLDHDPTIEQLEQIKAHASPKFPWQQSDPPSVEILMRRLQSLSGLIVQTKAELDHHVELVKTVSDRLEKLGEDENLSEYAQQKITSLRQILMENQADGGLEPGDAAILFTKNMLLNIIAPNVQIIPSGHEFLAEGGDTVLAGAIRSGLNVKYGCNNTTCGGCKARVISGQVLETETPQYALSDHEKRMGYMLMCCNAAVTDLKIEAGETVSPNDLPHQSVESLIANIQPLSENTHLLRLKTPEGQNFRFFAGQRATLTLSDGTEHTLPVFSCPCDRENLQFVVRYHVDNPAVKAFFAGLKQGELVTVTGPEGDFVLHDGSSNPSLFITAGDGFVAVKSLIEHAISIDRIEAFHVTRISSPGSPVHYHNLCRSWQDALDNFTYQMPELNDGSGTDLSSILGKIGELTRFDAYVAGPGDFTERVANNLTKLGMQQDRISIEVTKA